MNFDDFFRHHSSRRNAYQFLSIFYYPPEEDTLLKLPALQTTLENLCPPAHSLVLEMQTEQNLETLRVDFSGLFVGPFKLLAPPYGSVYLEGKREVMGNSTLDAQNQYRAAGLKLSGEVKEAPDHIALELEFVYFLNFKMLQAIEQSDSTGAVDYLEAQKLFLAQHLGRWIAKFSAAVQHHANTNFYKNLAGATQLFIQQDLANVSQLSATRIKQLIQQQVMI